MKSTSPGLPLAMFLASSATRSFLQKWTFNIPSVGEGGARVRLRCPSFSQERSSAPATVPSRQQGIAREATTCLRVFDATRGYFFTDVHVAVHPAAESHRVNHHALFRTYFLGASRVWCQTRLDYR